VPHWAGATGGGDRDAETLLGRDTFRHGLSGTLVVASGAQDSKTVVPRLFLRHRLSQ
jgi:hypothetical protein